MHLRDARGEEFGDPVDLCHHVLHGLGPSRPIRRMHTRCRRAWRRSPRPAFHTSSRPTAMKCSAMPMPITSVPARLPLHRGGLDLRGAVCDGHGPARRAERTARPQQQAGTAADACRHRRLGQRRLDRRPPRLRLRTRRHDDGSRTQVDRWIDVVIISAALATLEVAHVLQRFGG